MAKKERKLIEQNPKRKDDEDVFFSAWGESRGDKSFVFEKGKEYDLTILEINESETYRYTYKAKIDGIDKPIVLLGNASLNNGMGRGSWDVKLVEEGDDIRITYEGMYKSKKTGKSGYKIKVQLWE